MTKASKKRVPPDSPEIDPVDLPDGPDPRRLHEATDRLNTVLLDFEQALAQLKLGVTASITLEEDQQGWFKALSFAKSGREFKLVIRSGLEDDPDSISSTAITSTSRETRLQAVAALPGLYKKLLEEFETEIERVNQSIAEVQQLADVLRTRAGK
ncbi:hypothetical protein HY522_09775 [bacterium]|nr:hypothetical protein [bacterium]